MSDKQPRDRITIYSDYVCPFCYLGRQSLERYQDGRETELEIDWHPFDLRSQKRDSDGEIDDSVDDGKGEDYYEQARENVERLGEEYDVEMSQSLVTDVDSLPAQAASNYVKERYPYERWLAFDRAIFEALWQRGLDVGDPDVLADLAEEAALDPAEIRAASTDDAVRERVRELCEDAHREGITGVPTFVYDGYAARGAVPPEQLTRLVEGT